MCIRERHNELKENLLRISNVHWNEADVTKNSFQPIDKVLKNTWCTVTYTSGTGIDAVLHGVPNIACNSGSMVFDVSSKNLEDVENPYKGDKEIWTNKIAHCQWSIEEFESGECWDHVSKSI